MVTLVELLEHVQKIKKMIDLSSKHDLMFVTGPAGTGKTYTSVALAIKALKIMK